MLMLMLMLVLKTFLCQSADKSVWWIRPKAKFMLAVAPLIAAAQAGRDIIEALLFWKLQLIY